MELEKEGATVNNQAAGNAGHDFGYGFATAQNPIWTVDQVLLATGGRFIAGRPHAGFRSIATDSRNIEAGDLFLALTGDNFDGHNFIEDAVRQGAAGLIVARAPDPLPPVPVILVEDSLKALGDLAGFRRRLMRKLQVIAITGSSGKTTVKEMVASILEKNCNVLKTQGNFNNLVGMPLSLLPVDYAHDVAVLEMGMNQPGEIARLTEIADPDIACIVNVQDAHLLGLQDISGVTRAKGELFAGLKAWGKMVVNVDDKRVHSLARQYRQTKITFGLRKPADIRATHVRSCGEEGMAFTLHIGTDKARVALKSLGMHSVSNALAAVALAHAAGVGMAAIVEGLDSFRPYEKRLRVEKLACGVRVVNDTYNANPASVLAAMETLQGVSRNQRTVVVLGDMLELGKHSVAAHRFMGETAARLHFDYLLAVGSFAGTVVKAARKSGMPVEQAMEFESKDKLADYLLNLGKKGKLDAGDYILVKGSRGMRMETVIQELQNMSIKG